MTTDAKSSYYDAGGIETLKILKAKLTPEQYIGFLLGNVIKYSTRLNHKGCAERDTEKLVVYSKLLAKTTKSPSTLLGCITTRTQPANGRFIAVWTHDGELWSEVCCYKNDKLCTWSDSSNWFEEVPTGVYPGWQNTTDRFFMTLPERSFTCLTT